MFAKLWQWLMDPIDVSMGRLVNWVTDKLVDPQDTDDVGSFTEVVGRVGPVVGTRLVEENGSVTRTMGIRHTPLVATRQCIKCGCVQCMHMEDERRGSMLGYWVCDQCAETSSMLRVAMPNWEPPQTEEEDWHSKPF